MFTKAGTAIGYQSILAVIEQYGLGIVVLTAGARGAEAQQPIFELVVREVVQAAEEVARAEAGVYVGKYSAQMGMLQARWKLGLMMVQDWC